MKKPYFPIFIDLSEKTIVVVGGGTIASRRVKTILPFAGCVRVVSGHVTEELQALADSGEIEWIREAYTRERILDADMVLACTNDKEVNKDIYVSCKCMGIMVNNCSDGSMDDFFFPGIVRKDNVVVGITASGADHAQAKRVRERIQQVLETDRMDQEE